LQAEGTVGTKTLRCVVCSTILGNSKPPVAELKESGEKVGEMRLERVR
jgi:hypothetical protein